MKGERSGAAIPPSSPQRTDEREAEPRPETARLAEQHRGDVIVMRLPGVHLCQQRIRRAMRRLRDMPAQNGFIAEQIEECLKDLHIAIDAIQ